MAKAKRSSVASPLVLYSLLVAIVFLLVIILSYTLNRYNKYQLLAKTPNQACIGLAKAQALGYSLNLSMLRATAKLYDHNSDQITGSYDCTVGSFTSNTQQAAKYTSNTQGAEVIYFKSTQAAQKYAEAKVNPLCYFAVYASGTSLGNLPQTDLFVCTRFQPVPYFDDYSVKGNALIRLVVPCKDSQACESENTIQVLKNFRQSVQLINF